MHGDERASCIQLRTPRLLTPTCKALDVLTDENVVRQVAFKQFLSCLVVVLKYDELETHPMNLIRERTGQG